MYIYNKTYYQEEDFMKTGKDVLSTILDYEKLNESATLLEK